MFGRKKKSLESSQKQMQSNDIAAQDTAPADTEDVNAVIAAAENVQAVDNAKSAPADRATGGPFDEVEVPSIKPYVDLGSLKIAPREGLKMRLDVEDKTKRILAVTLDYDGSSLQMQAFSAPKSTGVWHEVRAQLNQSFVARGAKVVEKEGVFGKELFVSSGDNPEAALRLIGVDGPRWMLRGVIVGPAATDSAKAEAIESVFRETVVVRGQAPMPPSELLPLHIPAGASPTGENSGQDLSA